MAPFRESSSTKATRCRSRRIAAAKMHASSVRRGSFGAGSTSLDGRIVSPAWWPTGGQQRTVQTEVCRWWGRSRGRRQRPIRRATRRRFEVTKPGSERDGVVNSERGVNARVREFWTEISGSGRDHQGAFRTPAGLSRNRERPCDGRNRVTSCGKGGKAKTPRGEPLGVFRELVCRVCTQNRNELPE